jgi:hypothetical protein
MYTINSAKNHTRFIDRSASFYTTIPCLRMNVPLHRSTVSRRTGIVEKKYVVIFNSMGEAEA